MSGNLYSLALFFCTTRAPCALFSYIHIYTAFYRSKKKKKKKASWGKVMTLDQLKCRRRALVNRWCLCEEDEETIDHLLIHCTTARMLWVLFLSIVGTTWVFPHSIMHTLLTWQGGHVGKKQKKKSGWLLLYAFYGLYGGKEIKWCLITESPTLKKLNLIF